MSSSINPELLLIAKILDEGNLKKVIDAGFQAGDFIDETCEEHFSFLVNYYNDHYQSVPTRQLFQERYPQDHLPELKGRETLEDLISSTRRKQLAQECHTLGDELAVLAETSTREEDLQSGLQLAIERANYLTGRIANTRDISISGHASKVITEYHGAKDGRIRGVPWPWPRLTALTRGIEPGTLVLYYGRPKQMKSWVAMYQAAHFYQHNLRGGKVLLVTLEMPPELVARRISALLTRVDYEKFLQGKLVDEEEEVMIENLNELEAVESTTADKEFIIAAPDKEMSVSEIENKIEAYQPNLVVVDGVYLLRDARTKTSGLDWKVLGNVSTDLKRLAQSKKVPIIGVHQANRKDDEAADDLSDVAFTDMYARDADVLIKCIKVNSFNYGSVIALLFSGAREFKMSGFYIHGKPATSFDYIHDFNTKEELLAFIKKSKSDNARSANSPVALPDLDETMRKKAMGRLNTRFGGNATKQRP